MAEAIHQIFQRTAGRYGDRVAIEAAGRPVTYRELQERANGLAATLLASEAVPQARRNALPKRRST